MSDLMIRDKNRKLLTFEPNAVQKKYLDELCPQWRTGKFQLRNCREIILKARQFGFSTLIAALFFLDTINTPNTVTVVVAHDNETTERLFEMVKRFYDSLPPHKRPPVSSDTKRQMKFAHNGSVYYVATAGSKGAGRSLTINNLHGSEVAFWPNGDELASGLLQAVAEGGNVFLESTANGVGNFYHDQYTQANYEETAYQARFFPWFAHDEYQTDPAFAPAAPTEGAECERERNLVESHGLGDRQLAWRRKKRSEPGMNTRFVQEYPSSDTEAFVASGNPYFDPDIVSDLSALIAGGVFPCIELDLTEYPKLLAASRRTLSDARGAYQGGRGRVRQLEIYEAPDMECTYAVSADPSEGLTDKGKHDYCACDVINLRTGAQVAHLHGRWEPSEFAKLLDELGRLFFDALVMVERNNHGHAVLATLINVVKYPNLYYHEEYDQGRAKRHKKPGWPTHVGTKSQALDTLEEYFLTGVFQVRSAITVREMSTYVRLPGKKSAAEGASHDDAVSSAAIAVMAMTRRSRAQPPAITTSVTRMRDDAASAPTIDGTGQGRTMMTARQIGGLFVPDRPGARYGR